MSLPDIVLREHNGIIVVRDDLLPGGTKRRALPAILHQGCEYVYAGPVTGYAQLALAYGAVDCGATATVFVAKRKVLHPRTAMVLRIGGRVVQVPTGYLTNVQAKARAYTEASGATLLPFGLDTPAFIAALADVARALPVQPRQVWSVAGSGVLTRALQQAWPAADFRAVQIGRPPSIGRARLMVAPERYEDDAREPPPFPSCGNYDAKAWRFIRQSAATGALFWNVAA